MSSWRLMRLGAIGAALAAALGTCGAGLRAWRWRAPVVPGPPTRGLVGAVHVHTVDSGDSDIDRLQLARAAKARQLDFVVVTDHDSQGHRPSVVEGVLLIPQAEVSTPHGHVLALGGQLALLRDERSAHDVLERLRAQGVRPIGMHPSGPGRPFVGPLSALAGVEIDDALARLHRGPLWWDLWARCHALAPVWSVAQLLGTDTSALARWDALGPPAIGLCGSGVHRKALLPLALDGWRVVLPTLSRPLAWEGALAAPILAALAEGRFYNVVGLWPQPPDFYFGALGAEGYVAQAGDQVSLGQATRMAACLGRDKAAPAREVRIVLRHEGGAVATTLQGGCAVAPAAMGAWRAEVWAQLPKRWRGTRWTPVLYSNRLEITAP